MKNVRIYTEQALKVGNEVDLEGQAFRHVATVLRAKPEQELQLFNGDGFQYKAIILSVEKKAMRLQLLDKVQPNVESPFKITLLQCVSRGERMDYAVQKAVECGVWEIVPIISDRCEVKLNDKRAESRQQHWQRVAISASEQSGRCCVPVVHVPQKLSEWLLQNSEQVIVADPECKKPIFKGSFDGKINLLIGPEGGFSDKEKRCMQENLFCGISLGPRVLRTETAPVVAITLLQHCFGDLSN